MNITVKQIADTVFRLDKNRREGKPLSNRRLTDVEIEAMVQFILHDSVGAALRLLGEVRRLRKRERLLNETVRTFRKRAGKH